MRFGQQAAARLSTSVAAAAGQLSKLFLVARVTYPYSGAPKDGVCDEYWDGSWHLTNTTTLSSSGSVISAASAYDPVTKRIYMFGDEDATNFSRYYDTVSGTYNSITSLSVGGNNGFACVHAASAKCFIFGGITDYTGNYCSNVIQSYPINVGTPSQAFTTTSAVVPYTAQDIFGTVDSTNPDIVYFGGGNKDLLTGPHTSWDTWMRYDMSTPNTNPVLKTVMPLPLSMCACVDIGSEIILIGGFTDGLRGVGRHQVYAYNKAGNSWSTRPDYPKEVAGASAAYFGGAIYCAGGLDSQGWDVNRNPTNATTDVYKSTDGANTWTLHSNLLTKAFGKTLLVAQ